ncbi:protein dpy-30 homolog isoform X2 [Dermochelys coriacea]|uniref:protein dpy-30 homolog isoform X2 n=1 Tax=Dermochelys coriacea TaxID=27794 RepID=UPI0018E6DDB0|nr:protein dpy-30 homolog isoform X2 [Dermochelys coriacea]
MDSEQIMEGQAQVPENPHAEYGLTENVEVLLTTHQWKASWGYPKPLVGIAITSLQHERTVSLPTEGKMPPNSGSTSILLQASQAWLFLFAY